MIILSAWCPIFFILLDSAAFEQVMQHQHELQKNESLPIWFNSLVWVPVILFPVRGAIEIVMFCIYPKLAYISDNKTKYLIVILYVFFFVELWMRFTQYKLRLDYQEGDQFNNLACKLLVIFECIVFLIISLMCNLVNLKIATIQTILPSEHKNILNKSIALSAIYCCITYFAFTLITQFLVEEAMKVLLSVYIINSIFTLILLVISRV